jgi:hypothetical protein
MVKQTNKQSNKQTTKVIVKIGTETKPKRRRTRKNKKIEVQNQPPPPPQNQPPQPQFRPQSFGTLAPQNTSLNAFSSNIQSQLDNLLKSQSNLNTIVNKLRSEQRPEQNEAQNAQIISSLNLNSDVPINLEALMYPEPDEKEEFEEKEPLPIPPEPLPIPPEQQVRRSLLSPEEQIADANMRVDRMALQLENMARQSVGKKPVDDIELENRPLQRMSRSRGRSKSRNPVSRAVSRILKEYPRNNYQVDENGDIIVALPPFN